MPTARPSDEPAATVTCRDEPEVSVRLHSRYFPSEQGVGFSVSAAASGLRADVHGVEVWGFDTVWLPDFVGALAAQSDGWVGERLWATDRLEVRAAFHPGGRVSLAWELYPLVSRPDDWRLSVTTWVDAGEQLSRFAADLRGLLPWPSTGSAIPDPL
ncbi:DUF6228 family protein [Cellulomonas fimi]|uniref:Uncharacterized protein n=1 Tax=Cellulomonas fimi (strain ATCC 484 / DSM 20113 / JCM 1341 / CCUG 24087 / LMG 16345 / NBRC 15513 / NCIMB 8980 / NCTC 7547 / NRS-133) TaxID=590998 RepID=F4H7L9_CELFA|nr:DUF6228 family protein [Cellulomonas fimi]AEE44576.1 hypothetical protein Celf_0433 [Cellulomonas fimi ATCC 484]VEH26671.1 Uncharacterised protein [Cellulomonas fimi]